MDSKRKSILPALLLCNMFLILILIYKTIEITNGSVTNRHFRPRSFPARPTNTSNVRLLVWIMADPELLYHKVIHQKATWGRRIEKLLVMSSTEDKNFPSIGLKNVRNGRYHIASKAKAAWKYIYNHHGNDYDFFMKVDPDTYLVVENLLDFLADQDPTKPFLFGYLFNLKGHFYVSGGPGEILTREALRRLVTEVFVKHDDCWPDGVRKTNLFLEKKLKHFWWDTNPLGFKPRVSSLMALWQRDMCYTCFAYSPLVQHLPILDS